MTNTAISIIIIILISFKATFNYFRTEGGLPSRLSSHQLASWRFAAEDRSGFDLLLMKYKSHFC